MMAMNPSLSCGVEISVGTMTQADAELVARIREHDADAFSVLFARHRDRIRRHLGRTVGDAAAADDLAQEVFLRVWTRAGQWRGSGSVEAWLYRIATNLAYNHLRSRRRQRQRPLEIARPGDDEDDEPVVPGWMIDRDTPGPVASLEQAERFERLARFVGDLPEEKREVIRMVFEDDMDMQSTADALGIPEGTVKSRLHNARKQIARRWKDTEREEPL